VGVPERIPGGRVRTRKKATEKHKRFRRDPKTSPAGGCGRPRKPPNTKESHRTRPNVEKKLLKRKKNKKKNGKKKKLQKSEEKNKKKQCEEKRERERG